MFCRYALTIPTYMAKTISDPQAVVEFWDNVIDAMSDLLGVRCVVTWWCAYVNSLLYPTGPSGKCCEPQGHPMCSINTGPLPSVCQHLLEHLYAHHLPDITVLLTCLTCADYALACRSPSTGA